jgi:hypothetical protein
MRSTRFLIPFIALILAGCGGKSVVVPTQMVMPTPTPLSATPGLLAPTWTPESIVTQPEQNHVRPPTWTPRPTWTPFNRPTGTALPHITQTPRGTAIAKPPVLTATPIPQDCFNLKALTAEVRILVKQPARIAWNPVPHTDSYQVIVNHPGGEEIFNSVIPSPSIVLTGDLFKTLGAYGWQVWPVNDAGDRVCFPVSGEIIVSLAEGDQGASG